MTTPTTPEQLTAALLDIKAKIATCHKQEHGEPWQITATLRHKAMDAAARFVDPKWSEEEHPHVS